MLDESMIETTAMTNFGIDGDAMNLRKLGAAVAVAVMVAGVFASSGCQKPAPVEAEVTGAGTDVEAAAIEGDTTAEAAVDETTAASADAAAPDATAPDATAPDATAPDEGAPPAKPKTAVAAGGSWPMWGGSPGRNMVNTTEKNITWKWDVEKNENILWQQKLGSQSYGNVVIADGKIYVGTNNEHGRNPKITGDKGVIMCFAEDGGKFLWQAVHDKLEAGRVNDWPEQGICSSPVVEGDRIYYVSNRCELVCADAEGFLDGENDGPYKDEKYTDKTEGDFIWVYDMMDELGVFPHNLATCSPLMVGDLIFVVTSNGVERDHITIPNPRAPSFCAFNKKTGELVWDRNDPGEGILHGQWSAASYIEAGGRKQVVFPGGDGWVRSYRPKDGTVIWEFDCNPKDSKWELGGTRDAKQYHLDGRLRRRCRLHRGGAGSRAR